MEIMTNILKQGSEEQFAGLGDSDKLSHCRYERLLEMLLDSRLVIAVSLSESVSSEDIEDVGRMLMNIFEARGLDLDLLVGLIEVEVMKTESPANLFRRNSMATRLLNYYSKAQGQNYLKLTLKSSIEELALKVKSVSFEIDPLKVEPNTNTEENLRNLKVVAQSFLDAILQSVDHVPLNIRKVCTRISLIVGERFPEAGITAVGAFMFLRFICPVLVAPESVDLIYSVSRELRRVLVLITKIIQNLA